MVKKSIFKRIGYVGIAIVMALMAVPVIPSGMVSAAPADHCATRVHSSGSGQGSLSSYLRNYHEASLCDSMSDWRGLSVSGNATLDLSVYTLGTNITVSGGTLTIMGSGSFTGQLNKGNGGNFVILGGTYNSDPSAYVPEGYVVVEEQDDDGIEYTVKVRPEITASDVVAPTAISVKETKTYNLAEEIVLASGVEGEISSISLESANTGVANVAGGIVSGVTVGNTEITATISVLSYGATTRIQKNIAVEVTPLFTNFVLNEETNGVIALKEGQSVTLSLKSAETVDSLNNVTIDSVRLVSGGNLVNVSNRRKTVSAASGVGVGTTRIEVTARYTHNGRVFTLTRQIDVKVNTAMTGAEVRDAYDYTNTGVKYNSENGLELDRNTTKDLKIVTISNNNAAVTYAVESDNPDVAEANILYGSNTFRVNAKTPGTANITVTVTPRNAVDGEGAVVVRFAVKVNALLESITAENVEIDQGETGQIVAVANDGLVPTYTYREMTFGERKLNINEDGSFTARDGKYGETTVLVMARKGNRTAMTTMTVKVNPVLKSIALKDSEITVYEGDTAQIEIEGVNEEAIRDQVVWSYGGHDHAIAGVSNTGKITPRRDGTTTVTVTGTYVSPLGKTYTATATVNVIVKSKLESITVQDINVKVDERADFDITVDADDITPRYTYEYADGTIARNSRAGGVRALKAGDTEVTVTARHFGKTVTATATVHVYEMEAPEHHHYYGATGQVFDVHVGDKNTNAYTRASVDKPWGMIVMGDRAIAFAPGIYTVTYTDYMANGEIVGEYTAEFTVYRVEHETVVVEQGETVELDGHSEWSTTSAKDETTGHHVRVNSEGKVVFATDEETALGVHNVTMKHMFRYDAREVVKETTVIVYNVIADPESDPEGITGDTLKEYIEGMFDDITSMEDLMERMQEIREVFGDGWEGMWSVMGVSGAIMNGNEIDTRVEVIELDEEDVDAAMLDAVEELGVDGVEYYDVSVWMSSNGVDFGRLHQLNNKITVALAKVTDPESGYARKYIVVRQHEGEEPEVLAEGVDFYIEDGVLYVISDRFSTFAVAYQDTMIPAYGGEIVSSRSFAVKAPETGVETAENGSADNTAIMALVVASAAMTLAGAVVFAKRK